MLRSFEEAIINETKAEVADIPPYRFASKYLHHFGHGMDRALYRRYFPKQSFLPESDVMWYILMGPENYRLDLYKGWERKAKRRILYIYDTMPSQYPVIKRLLSDNTWDILITSFNDAVDDLERTTGRKWHCVEQAADKELFKPAPLQERVIHFSSYGRRYPVLHDAVREFCKSNDLYYDYTTHDGRHPVVDSTELYRQYAWHVNHSIFNFSWPVELTNPQRAGHLRPVTCRWFEAAAAGTVIVGKAPSNPIFGEWLDKDIVINIDPGDNKAQLFRQLDNIWNDRERLFERAQKFRDLKWEGWTWNDRVNRIKSWL